MTDEKNYNGGTASVQQEEIVIITKKNNELLLNKNLEKQQIFINNKLEINEKNESLKPSLMDYSKLSGRNSVGGGSSGGGGGRLQFFKDGKFILEIARTPEGEKGKWVSVPRKINKRQFNVSAVVSESSTSLSMSDDNSSIQSSPRQRERSWKQSTPRKNNSKGITLVLQKNTSFSSINIKSSLITRLKRRPFENIFLDSKDVEMKTNNTKTNAQTNEKIKAEIKTEKTTREKINVIAQKLTDKLSKKSLDMKAQFYDKIMPSASATRILDFQYQQHVSPRKRILKELEKVSLDDNTKRSRPKCTSSVVSTTKSSNFEALHCSKANKKLQSEDFQLNNNNNVKHEKFLSKIDKGLPTTTTSSKQYSSYTINSLLGNSNRTSSPIEQKPIHLLENSIDISLIKNEYGTADTNITKKPVQYCSSSHEVEKTSVSTPTIDYENNNITPEIYSYKKQMKKLNAIKAAEKSLKFHPSTSSPSSSSSSKYLNEEIYKKSENTGGFTLNHNTYSSPFIPIAKYTKPNDCSLINSTSGNSYDNAKRLNRLTDLEPLIATGIKNRKIRESQTSPLSEDLSYTARNLHSNFTSANTEENDRNRRILTSSPRQESSKNKIYSTSELTKPPPSTHSIPTSPLYYLYPQNGLTHSSPYIQTAVPYYHPYATSASLRNSMWMNYQPGISTMSRIPAPYYNYNGMPSLSSSVDSLQINSLKSNLEPKSVSTNSVAIAYTNEEDCNSDVPLNLSKH